MLFCGKCGETSPDGMSFCGHCGSALALKTSSPIVTQPPSLDKSSAMNSLGYDGVSNLVTIGELMTSEGIKQVSALPGIYLVLYMNKIYPRFLEVGTGGHFKERNPNVSIERLVSKWVEDAPVIYIGQTTDSLRKRIKTYMKYGQGEPVAHHGGRFIWQIEGSRELMMCWKPMKNDENPEQEEKRLMKMFISMYGTLPFANLRE